MRVYGRGPHYFSLILFSLLWFFCVLFLFLPFTVSAAGVTYETTRVGPASYAPNGVTAPITVNVAPPGGVPRYQQVVPVASPSTLGKLGRKLIRGGGVGLVVTGAIEGLGYLIDEATGDITKPLISFTDPQASGNFVYGTDTYSLSHCPLSGEYTPPDRDYMFSTQTSSYCGYDQGSVYEIIYAGWNCPITHPFSIAASGTTYQKCFEDGSYSEEVIEWVPIDETDISDIDTGLWSSLSISQKAAILKAAISEGWPRGDLDSNNYPINPLTSPNSAIQNLFSMWPELRVAYQNMLNAEIAAILAASDPEFSPSPDEQVIIDDGTTLPPGGGLAVDLPPFCEWALFFCDPFIPESHPDVPVLDIETPTYDSGLPSSAICPAPYQVVTGFGTWEITFQFACDMASAIRTPLIAIAYLMSAFIVVGVRK